MSLLKNMAIGAVLLGGLGLAPLAAKAQDACQAGYGYTPAHYETRTIEAQGEGRWVDQEKCVTIPGRWEEFDREQCTPAHYETRCQQVQLPGHYQMVNRQVRDGCGGYQTVCQQVWVPG